MPIRQYPWNDPAKYAYENEYRIMFRHIGNGVLNDATGLGCKVTANGSNQVLSVGIGDFKCEGFVREATDTDGVVTLDSGATGAQPSAGQSRYDLVVMRSDLTAKSITPVLLTSAPGTNPTRPALTRTTTVYDEPIARVIRGTAAITQAMVVDERKWIGPHLVCAAHLPDAPVSLGSRATSSDGFVYERRLNSSGVAAWAIIGGYSLGSLGYLTGYSQMPSPYNGDTPRYVQSAFGVTLGGMFYRSAETFTRAAGAPFDVTPPLPTAIRPTNSRYLGVVDTFLGPAKLIYAASTGRLNVQYQSAVTITSQTWWVSLNSVAWVKE